MKEQKIKKLKNHKVHLLGICGISMSALALKLSALGFKVSGYDRNTSSPIYDNLINNGITINQRQDLIESETVVYSSAISQDNEQFAYAKKTNKNLISRAQLLKLISERFKTFVGVAGTHGKTTCTSIIAHIFHEAQLSFDAHIGGLDKTFGNYYMGGDQIFLSELCEYKKNLAYFSPDYSVLLNIDNDHLESYGSYKKLREEFIAFANRSTCCVYSDKTGITGLKNGVSFSLKNPKADYFLRVEKGESNFSECAVYEHGAPLLKINMKKFMPYDAGNILASIALSRTLLLDCKSIVCGIENFSGVARRNEVIYSSGKSLILADYAHHPSQIQLAISGYIERFGECIFLFQPHTYSRTRDLFNEFVGALSNVSNLYLFTTYGAREKYDYEGSAKRLQKYLPKSVFAGDSSCVKSVVDELICRGLPIIVLGAGDIYEKLVQSIKN